MLWRAGSTGAIFVARLLGFPPTERSSQKGHEFTMFSGENINFYGWGSGFVAACQQDLKQVVVKVLLMTKDRNLSRLG